MSTCPCRPWLPRSFGSLAACLSMSVALSCTGATGSPHPRWTLPENGWPKTSPPLALLRERAQGFEVGQVLPDLRLTDQRADLVALWQFYGRVLLVSLGAVWCAPCRDLAVEAQAMAEEHPEMVHLTVLLEDGSGLTPDTSDAAAWASAFSPDQPVLVDPEQQFGPALDGGYPDVLLVNRELTVEADPADLSADHLRDLLQELLEAGP